jgi:phosphoribosylanthranilate isomerase
MGAFLEVIHEIHDRRELLKDGEENQAELALPKDIRTVEARADGTVHLDYDVEVQERHFDQSTLGQQCKVLSVFVTDPFLALQALLLDAPAPGVYGGTGETFDWSVAAAFIKRHPALPVILAGGIVPGNAADALAAVHPAALDVASGSESAPGIKDFEKVSALLAAVRMGR